jgi:hypothetical protein
LFFFLIFFVAGFTFFSSCPIEVERREADSHDVFSEAPQQQGAASAF